MSVAQAEMQDELEDAKRNAPWMDITQGMELLEKLEHELELWGRSQLLDPSLRRNLSRDRKMPQWRGMATPMVRGMTCTTGSAASGVNAMGQPADSGDRRPSGS